MRCRNPTSHYIGVSTWEGLICHGHDIDEGTMIDKRALIFLFVVLAGVVALIAVMLALSG